MAEAVVLQVESEGVEEENSAAKKSSEEETSFAEGVQPKLPLLEVNQERTIFL